ncbi:hypothetical protein D3C85_1705110 [compost metagenome]
MVRREILDAPRNGFIQALGYLPVRADHLPCFKNASYALQVHRGATPPGEGTAVERHGGTIEFDGLKQGSFTHRQPTLLIGIAEHKGVGRNRIAH